jgi:hypothetical protein
LEHERSIRNNRRRGVDFIFIFFSLRLFDLI